jgi:hypothetical protein
LDFRPFHAARTFSCAPLARADQRNDLKAALTRLRRAPAGRLTLTKLQDASALSAGLYTGVWKREKT